MVVDNIHHASARHENVTSVSALFLAGGQIFTEGYLLSITATQLLQSGSSIQSSHSPSHGMLSCSGCDERGESSAVLNNLTIKRIHSLVVSAE